MGGIILKKKMTDMTTEQYQDYVLEEAKAHFEAMMKNSIDGDYTESLAAVFDYIYSQAHNRGWYDCFENRNA